MADIPAASAARVEQGFTQVGVLLTSRVTKTQHDTDLAAKVSAVRINGVTYNAANGIVDAGTIAGGSGGTSTVAGLTDASTVGKQVMTAATAAAARSALGAADTASIATLQSAKADAASTPTKTQTISSLAVSGSTLTATRADGTTQAVTLPAGSGTGGGSNGAGVLALTKIGGVWYRDYGSDMQVQFTAPAPATGSFWLDFPVILAAMPEATSLSEVPSWLPDRASVDIPVAAAVAG